MKSPSIVSILAILLLSAAITVGFTVLLHLSLANTRVMEANAEKTHATIQALVGTFGAVVQNTENANKAFSDIADQLKSIRKSLGCTDAGGCPKYNGHP